MLIASVVSIILIFTILSIGTAGITVLTILHILTDIILHGRLPGIGDGDQAGTTALTMVTVGDGDTPTTVTHTTLIITVTITIIIMLTTHIMEVATIRVMEAVIMIMAKEGRQVQMLCGPMEEDQQPGSLPVILQEEIKVPMDQM